MNRPAPSPHRHGCLPGFTLVEVVMALALGSVVMAAVLAAMVFLQKSYAATEQYAVNLADQSRLMDYLTLDLRRAVNVTFTTDASGQTNGLTISVPPYYSSADPFSPNTPRIYLAAAYYGSTPGALPLAITYRQRASFNDPRLGLLLNVVTRQESGGPEAAVAAGMDAFPEVIFDAADGTSGVPFTKALRARLKVVFRPHFQTPATPSSNTFVLHGLVFLRNNDAQRE